MLSTDSRISASASGSELPDTASDSACSTDSTPTAAAAPAARDPPDTRRATLNAITAESTAPARAIKSQRSGAAPPNTDSSVQTNTGSGLNAGPSAVLSSND